MGQITALFVQKVLQIAKGPLDPEALLAEAGIESAVLRDPRRMVDARAYYTLLERLAHIDMDPVTLPLRAGAAMRCDDYGAFGLAWQSARTLRGSFERAQRYARVLTSVTRYQVEEAEGLGLSSRSLQRSLARQGFSYQALVDDTRRQLACCLLRESSYGLSDIAFMTGFSDQSAFTRAFRRWEGQTPRSFRLDALPPA